MPNVGDDRVGVSGNCILRGMERNIGTGIREGLVGSSPNMMPIWNSAINDEEGGETIKVDLQIANRIIERKGCLSRD